MPAEYQVTWYAGTERGEMEVCGDCLPAVVGDMATTIPDLTLLRAALIGSDVDGGPVGTARHTIR